MKKNLAYNFLLSVSQVLLPFISLPYVTRILHPEGIGRVSFIDSYTYYFLAVAEFGIVAYGIREVAKVKQDKAQLRKLVAELLMLHIVTSGITLLLYAITTVVLWQKIGDIRLLYCSLSFLLVNFFACEWYFWGQERFRYITIRSLITRLLGFASLFFLVKTPGDYYRYYAIIVFAATGNMVWNIFTLFREVPLTTKGIDWRRHARYTWVTYLVSLFYSIPLLLDTVLLRLVSTPAAAGLYALSVKIARVTTSFLTDIFVVLYPRTVTLVSNRQMEEVQQTILKSSQLIVVSAIPACAGLWLLADPFVHVFFGERFYAISANIRILCLLPLVKGFSLFFNKQILMTYNKERLFLKGLVAGSLLFIVATLVLSGYYMDAGASYAIMLSEIIVLLISFYYVKQTIPSITVFHWPSFWQSLVAVLLFIPVIYLLKQVIPIEWLYLVISVAGCGALYFFVMIFIFRNKLLYTFYRQGYDFLFNKSPEIL